MAERTIEFSLAIRGERLDKILAAALPELSRMQWQRLVKDKMVTVDGQTARVSQRVYRRQTVFARIPPAVESDLLAEDIPLDVRYEDSDILVVNKPAGMVVHPGTGHQSGTLVNALLYHCPDLAGIGNTKRPGIVHRLDKNTSGLLVVAKNDKAQRYLQKQFKSRTVGKKYLALVDGQIQPPAALIDAPIGRDPRQRKKMSVIVPGSPRASSSRARPAQTNYRTLQSFDEYSYLECQLHTGRTHQIRVHLAYAGYPIVGDTTYGRRKQRLKLARYFLHAAELTLKRPSDEQEMSFAAELPAELVAILEMLNGLRKVD